MRRDVPGIKAGLRDLELRGAHADAVDDLFAELGWGRIVDRIPRFR